MTHSLLAFSPSALAEGTSTVESPSLFDDNQTAAERILLDLADYVYTQTSLKPMSKTLFLISRCLLLAEHESALHDSTAVATAYECLRSQLGVAAPEDDYSFPAVLDECADHVPHIMGKLGEVRRLTHGTDCLGLAFNALLRGKIEGGEGLGTYLTPEEVVEPMVAMAIATIAQTGAIEALRQGALFGDICGGTGRFVFALSEQLNRAGIPESAVCASARLYDQSRLAVDLARINFILRSQRPDFKTVSDSLVDERISNERGQYSILATNPPFGAGKYRLGANTLPWLDSSLLKKVLESGRSGGVDPATLFILRNLDLLALGGVLAIVLPDGIARSKVLLDLFRVYERTRNCCVNVIASISLPASTFALGGTVAKTSFLLIQKSANRLPQTPFTRAARHIGFVKRGNRRATDANGNELIAIAKEYVTWLPSHLNITSAAPHVIGVRPTHSESDSFDARNSSRVVGDVAVVVKDRARGVAADTRAFHVSILDVDATGQIDIVAARSNDPASRGIKCRPGDVILSCLNPNHWRVTVIPELEADWSCSPEFLVLRPLSEDPLAGLQLSLHLHHQSVIRGVREKAIGTSSSRQRVSKSAILDVPLPTITLDRSQVAHHGDCRLRHYERRLFEAAAYERLHDGTPSFSLESV